MKGSTPILAGLVLAFLAAFAGLRACSPFRRIEAEAAFAAAVARDAGLTTADVMALREMLGVALPEPDLRRQAVAFVALRGRYGEGLAAVAVAGHEAVVRDAVAQAGGDGALAWSRFQARPEAIWGVRFLAMRARFGDRAAARM